VLKIKLIPEWRKAWKYFSVIFSFVGVVVSGVIEFYGAEIPSSIYSLLFVVVLIGRLVQQGVQGDDAN